MPTITEAKGSAAMIVDLEEGEIPLRRLVREALRWRPSRLVVREVRQQQERLGPSPCAATHTGHSHPTGVQLPGWPPRDGYQEVVVFVSESDPCRARCPLRPVPIPGAWQVTCWRCRE
jgi:hypothetical protein